MAKEDDVVAAAMAKPIREGYPILTEEHPFFGKLRWILLCQIGEV